MESYHQLHQYIDRDKLRLAADIAVGNRPAGPLYVLTVVRGATHLTGEAYRIRVKLVSYHEQEGDEPDVERVEIDVMVAPYIWCEALTEMMS